MKAVVFRAKEDLQVEEIDAPTPGPGQVKLRNAYAGICGSDLHLYYSPESSGLDVENPHPLTGAMPPQILGHEFSGTVVEVGQGVKDVSVGDRVAVWPVYYCNECSACRRGAYNVCRKIAFHGLSSHGGGMAEYTVVDAGKVHVLPESVDLRLGALVEPMAVAWHAVARSGIKPGDRALIVGVGPIGIGIWFALRAQGIKTVIVSETSESRREIIARLGAENLIDPSTENFPARIAELTGGEGVDVAFDAAGVGIALSTALDSLAPLGRAVIVAIHERAMDFVPTQLVLAETEIVGTLAYLPSDFDAVIAAMATGLYDTTGWVSEVGLDDVKAALGELRAGLGAKVLVAVS